ncbi:MAG TPA: ABC transporter ATP-binding protein [Candidatus Paceibacterota bacterium]|nr:ABC transporter ATP-binding protein [Candidatus Paceibacterota bacterium]HMO82941.1 ABC transporter ATP-binding protein [Candidatus Paceibacterota bacterium]
MSQENTAVLTLQKVSKSFIVKGETLSILENISLTLNRGEKIAIIGPSGSGKSTLLSLIGLLDKPTSGEIFIDSISTNFQNEQTLAQIRNQKIGFIFQAFELINPFTVRENISVPLEIAPKNTTKASVNSLIQAVGLDARSEALPSTLSGGEKQRVAIARALVNDPQIILADEPTGSLDRETGERVLDLLLSTVSTQNRSLIIITHDENIAKKMDRVFEIKNKTIHERH